VSVERLREANDPVGGGPPPVEPDDRHLGRPRRRAGGDQGAVRVGVGVARFLVAVVVGHVFEPPDRGGSIAGGCDSIIPRSSSAQSGRTGDPPSDSSVLAVA